MIFEIKAPGIKKLNSNVTIIFIAGLKSTINNSPLSILYQLLAMQEILYFSWQKLLLIQDHPSCLQKICAHLLFCHSNFYYSFSSVRTLSFISAFSINSISLILLIFLMSSIIFVLLEILVHLLLKYLLNKRAKCSPAINFISFC